MLKIKINNFYIVFRLSAVLIFLLMIALGYTEQFFILYVFMICHETIHILAAGAFGCKLKSIDIMPAGLCGNLDGVEELKLYKRNIILVTAPLFNIIIGFVFNKSYIGWGNILIGVFNLLPVYPLDGSLLFQNIMGYFFGTLRADKWLKFTGRFIIGLLFFAAVAEIIFMGFSFVTIAVAMYLYNESKKLRLKRAYYFYKCIMNNKNNCVNKIRFKRYYESTVLKEIMYNFGIDYYTIIYINGTVIDEDKIKGFITEYGINAQLGDILNNFSL